MAKRKTALVPFESVTYDLFVRKAVNAEQEDLYQQIYQAGGPDALPPVEVADIKGVLTCVEGRHRTGAAKRLGWTELPTIHLGPMTLEEAMLYAIKANGTGPAPATAEDLKYIVGQLVTRFKYTQAQCVAALPQYPGATVIRNFNNFKLAERTRKAGLAVRALRENPHLTAAQAALKVGADVRIVQRILGLREPVVGLKELHLAFTGQFKSHGQRMRKIYKTGLKAIERGQLTSEELTKFLEDIFVKAQRNAQGLKNDWLRRLRSESKDPAA